MDGLTGNTAHQVNWINILTKVMSVELSFTLLYGKIPLKDAFLSQTSAVTAEAKVMLFRGKKSS